MPISVEQAEKCLSECEPTARVIVQYLKEDGSIGTAIAVAVKVHQQGKAIVLSTFDTQA